LFYIYISFFGSFYVYIIITITLLFLLYIIAQLEIIKDIDYYASISSYFSNWTDIFIKFFKQVKINKKKKKKKKKIVAILNIKVQIEWNKIK